MTRCCWSLHRSSRCRSRTSWARCCAGWRWLGDVGRAVSAVDRSAAPVAGGAGPVSVRRWPRPAGVRSRREGRAGLGVAPGVVGPGPLDGVPVRRQRPRPRRRSLAYAVMGMFSLSAMGRRRQPHGGGRARSTRVCAYDRAGKGGANRRRIRRTGRRSPQISTRCCTAPWSVLPTCWRAIPAAAACGGRGSRQHGIRRTPPERHRRRHA